MLSKLPVTGEQHKTGHERGYRPIRDYAFIGDGHTAALVASDGSIDWYCCPRFDSPAVLCRLLDAHKGGWIRVGPSGEYATSRAYVENTNVLATTFTTGDGQLRLTDLMPIQRRAESRSSDNIEPGHRILRLVEGLTGEVDLEVHFRPTFNYARSTTTLLPCRGGAIAHTAGESLTLACPARLEPDASGGLSGRIRVTAGERFWIVLTYHASSDVRSKMLQVRDADAELARTIEYWRGWSARCTYLGPYHELVRRSALTLKLLTFMPSGALVAAPTTSLPEEIGGARNWDYRYTWLRDSALVLSSLMAIGYHDEALAFFDWLQALSVNGRGDLKIMYRIDHGTDLPEQILDHLEGYRKSRPVRIGNSANMQMQLDIYGAVMSAMYYCYEHMDPPTEPLWPILGHLADQAAARWREPDSGIWEIRDRPRHFLHSKLMCWVALDRAVRLAGPGRILGDAGRWRRSRDEIREAILDEGYNEEIGAFTQAFGEPALDSSVLTIPLVGFLPPTDPRVRSTVDRIQERLTSDGLVYRYVTDDGLPGGEATFALCSFWMVDNLALADRVDEARTLFDRLVGYANDVGLLSEQIMPATGELLGNFPQGFTHLALIRSALNIAKAEAR